MDLRRQNGDSNGNRANKWSVTCNLKEVKRSTVDECIARARQSGWKVYGQLEKGGKEHTDHFQLAVKTPQVRFSAVKKMFPTAHIEVAEDWNALFAYCHKEETRIESIDAKEVATSYIPWSQLRQLFAEYVCEDEFLIHTTDPERRLQVWDRFIGHLIEEGNEVDLMGMNANYRACISRYWHNYINRYMQTQRQTDTQEVLLPTLI